MLYLVLLDDRHLADLLFVQALGRLAAGSGLPLVFVHGEGGLVARALEARGHFPGDPVSDDLRREIAGAGVAAHRARTQALTRRLTDAVVPAVGVQGSDRRLLVRRADGGVEAPGAAWLADLVGRGAVPVVGLVARDDGPGADAGEAVPVAAGEALVALGRALAALGPVEVVVLAGQPVGAALDDGEAVLAAASDPEAARAVVAAGVPLRVATPPSFFASGGPGGARIGPE